MYLLHVHKNLLDLLSLVFFLNGRSLPGIFFMTYLVLLAQEKDQAGDGVATVMHM